MNFSSSHSSGLQADGSSLVERADHGTGPRRAEHVAELLVVLLGDAEQVGNHQQRERLCVRAEELAVAVGDEVVEAARRPAAT